MTCDWEQVEVVSFRGVPTLPVMSENDVEVDKILPASSYLQPHLQVNSDGLRIVRCCLPVALHFCALCCE